MNRTTWCEMLVLRLNRAIAGQAPPGLGAWPTAWGITEAPMAALVDELDLIERGQGDPAEAVRLGEEVLAAWTRAAAEWREKVAA